MVRNILCDSRNINNCIELMGEESAICFREKDDFRSGAVFVVDKPIEWTSFDVVNKIRNCLRKKYGKIKVGHAGTLDPLATGVVIVCTGKETKEIERYMGGEKEYIAQITFGHTTPSFDLETDFDEAYDWEHLSREVLDEAILRFTGEIEQLPPVYSAVRINGERAYEKARRGDDVEMKPRQVFIRELEVVSVEMPVVTLRIVCSKGTYIRSLAHDLGQACGSGSHLSGLKRIRVGEFTLDKAFNMEELIEILKEKCIID